MWLKRFDSKHPLINIYLLSTSFNRRALGSENKNILILAKGTRVSFYRLNEENKRLRNCWFKEFLDRQKMLKNISFSQRAIDQMDELVVKIKSLDCSKLSKQKLYWYYKKYIENFRVIFISYNMSQPEVTEPVENYLKERLLKIVKDKNRAQKYFLKLTLPSEINLLTTEQFEWLKIVKKVGFYKNKGIRIANIVRNPRIRRLILKHSKMYGWISTQENLPFMDVNYYEDLLKEYFKSTNLTEIKKRISKIRTTASKIEQERAKILKKINNDPIIKTATELLRKMGFLRINLRLIWTKGAYYTRPIFTKIGEELNLGILDVKFLFPWEIHRSLIKNKRVHFEEIKKRKICYIMWLQNGKLQIFTGKKVKSIIKQEKLDCTLIQKKNIIKGITANPGYVKGEVKIIHSHQKFQIEEVKQMKRGQILVAGSTKPQLIEACRKAIGIVTDEGGLLSHAAIVSRELGIPCIVGTKISTKILKDNDIIEMDADKGIIKKLHN